MNVSLHNAAIKRSGVTLIEMLVVVAIMMFMLGIAAPMFRPDQAGSVARDTARALNAYIQEARAKAMATGRPCGVALIPFETYPSACVVAQQVEAPPLYTGESYQSTVTVTQGNTIAPSKLTFNNVSANWTQKDNMIRLGGRGVWYQMTGATTCALQAEDSNLPDASFRPWTSGNWTTTFEIQAAPVSQAKNYLQSIGMAEPLKVIRGSAIDLVYSKVGSDIKNKLNNISNIKPIIIMFTPTGEVGLCYRFSSGSSTNKTPTDKLYILCGQWDRALTAFQPEDGKRNHETFDSYWIIIDPATGNSTIEQNVP